MPMAVLGQYDLLTNRNTRDHLVSVTLGTGIPCTRCVSHARYLAHKNSKGEARGSSRHKNNGRRVVRDL